MERPRTPEGLPPHANAASDLIYHMDQLIKNSDAMTDAQRDSALKNLLYGRRKNGVNMLTNVGYGVTPILSLIHKYALDSSLTEKQRLMILQLAYTLVNEGELNSEYTKKANEAIRSLSEYADLTALKRIVNHHFESRKQLLAMVEGVDTLPPNLEHYRENEDDLRMRFLTSQAREIAPFMMAEIPTMRDVKKYTINGIRTSTPTPTPSTPRKKTTPKTQSIRTLSSMKSLSSIESLSPLSPIQASSVLLSSPSASFKTKSQKVCPEGKVLNPKTGRCIKIKTKKNTTIKTKTKPQKVCPEGKVLNPKTGRCIKIKSKSKKR